MKWRGAARRSIVCMSAGPLDGFVRRVLCLDSFAGKLANYGVGDADARGRVRPLGKCPADEAVRRFFASERDGQARPGMADPTPLQFDDGVAEQIAGRTNAVASGYVAATIDRFQRAAIVDQRGRHVEHLKNNGSARPRRPMRDLNQNGFGDSARRSLQSQKPGMRFIRPPPASPP